MHVSPIRLSDTTRKHGAETADEAEAHVRGRPGHACIIMIMHARKVHTARPREQDAANLPCIKAVPSLARCALGGTVRGLSSVLCYDYGRASHQHTTSMLVQRFSA
jgi:hypothetical protein